MPTDDELPMLLLEAPSADAAHTQADEIEG
jgi:hypothetical protein